MKLSNCWSNRAATFGQHLVNAAYAQHFQPSNENSLRDLREQLSKKKKPTKKCTSKNQKLENPCGSQSVQRKQMNIYFYFCLLLLNQKKKEEVNKLLITFAPFLLFRRFSLPATHPFSWPFYATFLRLVYIPFNRVLQTWTKLGNALSCWKRSISMLTNQ